ncbi:MAG: hypothetical protein U0936_24055 [Planctomycetaceae bacterium]
MPDLNGRRYETYLLAAQLTELTGQPMPHLRQRAEELKTVPKQRLGTSSAVGLNFRTPQYYKRTPSHRANAWLLAAALDAAGDGLLASHLDQWNASSLRSSVWKVCPKLTLLTTLSTRQRRRRMFSQRSPGYRRTTYKAGHPDVSEDILKRTAVGTSHAILGRSPSP